MREIGPLLLLLLVAACGKHDDSGNFGHAGGGGKDTSGGDSAEDTAVDTGATLDNGGGGDDTWSSSWSRCDDGGQTWTFHAELNYAAHDVNVGLDVGTPGYEVWYLAHQDSGRTIWEVTVPDGLSSHTCDETVELLWIANGATGWSVTYSSEYTPP